MTAAEATATVPRTAPVRVLVADDTADVRLLLTMCMAERPDVVVVGEAADGAEAVRMAATLQPDLVVLDVAMPVLDGMSALPRLREVAPRARVVVLSSLPAADHRPLARAAGAAAYVEKSTSVRVIVDELLHAANVLDAVVAGLTEAPHAASEARLRLTRHPRDLAVARRFVVDTLQGWRADDLADTVALLVTELVANAFVHTTADPDVTVRLLPHRVHVEVADADATSAPAARPPTADGTSGRGLALVEALSLAWGTDVRPTGKVVWFDVPRTGVGRGDVELADAAGG